MISFLFTILVFAGQANLKQDWDRARLKETAVLQAQWEGSSPLWEGKWGKQDLRLESFHGDANQLKARVAERVAEVRSLYEPFVDPYYPGVTDKIECPKAYRLVETRKKGIVLFRYFANARKVPGACTKDSVYFQVDRAIVDCPGASAVLDLTLYRAGQADSQAPWPDLYCRD